MSVEIGTSLQAEVPALKALWKQAFGDDDDCIDLFFRTAFTPEGVLVLRENGVVRAMACYLPETVCWARRGWSAAYLYAVATDRCARGRGYCGQLLAYAESFLKPRGVKVLLLVPGEESLRRFYEKHGYADFSTVSWAETPYQQTAGDAEWVEPPAYLELRERLLGQRAYVSCPVPVLEFQNGMAQLYGGGLLRLTVGETEGCACAAKDASGRAVCYELLWPGDVRVGASLVMRAVSADQALVRTPGDAVPFAMAKWLIEPPDLPAPFLGIALD